MTGVYKKEMRSFLTTMTGYVFIAFLLAVIGVYYAYINLNLASPKFELVLNNVQFVFIVFVPLLTMRSLAEERGQRTDQLLLTLPLKVYEIVIGKFFALVTIFAVPTLIICAYPMILGTSGTVYYPSAYLSVLGFFLLGCADIAICIFLSSLTENSVIAAVMSFGVLLFLYLMNSISGMIPNTAIASYLFIMAVIVICGIVIYQMIHQILITILLVLLSGGIVSGIFGVFRTSFEGLVPRVLNEFYMNGKLTGFFDGILDTQAVIYYVSIMAFALFLTIQSISKRRWN